MQEQEVLVDFQRPLQISSRILRGLGLWSKSPCKFFACDLYTIYSFSIVVAFNLLCASEIAYWFMIPSDFEAIAYSGVVLFSKLETNAKVYCIIRHQSMAKRFLNECNKKVFQPKTLEQAERAKDVFWFYKLIYITFGVGGFSACTGLSFYPLLGHHDQPVLPFIAWYPYNYTLHFFPTYCHQLVTSYYISFTHVNTDCFSIGLVAFIVVQCDILVDTIKNLRTITISSLAASGRRDVSGKELVREMERQFYNCILHHKEILRWFKEIYNMLSVIIVTQYITSTLTLCMTLIQASYIEFQDPRFTANAIYAMVMLGQLFLFCWWGNEVISKSSQIPMATFGCDWLDMSANTKKDLLTFAHCTQTPMEFFGADYFSVSLGNYMLILKHSYSFFAVLSHMNN